MTHLEALQKVEASVNEAFRVGRQNKHRELYTDNLLRYCMEDVQHTYVRLAQDHGPKGAYDKATSRLWDMLRQHERMSNLGKCKETFETLHMRFDSCEVETRNGNGKYPDQMHYSMWYVLTDQYGDTVHWRLDLRVDVDGNIEHCNGGIAYSDDWSLRDTVKEFWEGFGLWDVSEEWCL